LGLLRLSYPTLLVVHRHIAFGSAITRSLANRFFSCAGAMLVSPHDGRIDHHVFIIVIARQHLENAFELGPPAEVLVHRFPVTKPLRQVTPRTASSKAVEHGFEEQAIIFRGTSDMAFTARKKIFDPIPLIVS
jgi:hypothetical protein